MNQGEALTHFTPDGASHMVDVGDKPETHRTATASAMIRMQPATLARLRQRDLSKGDALEVARLAGIMAAKRTPDLIPLCHPLPISSAAIEFDFPADDTLRISATVAVFGRTGVEMEALTAVSIAALTIYDMVKSIDRGVVIGPTRLESKRGGRSGDWTAPGSTP